jgi:type IV pilus assembly protein PilP
MKSLWGLVASMVLLAGCVGDDHQNLKDWMIKESGNLRGHIQPLPKIIASKEVDYDAGALVEPFQASRIEPEKRPGSSANRPDTNRRREPLEAYPLESLKMVGMMMMNNRPVALIQADKSVYQVKAGNYLGQSFGVITKISDTELTLKELIEDANGDWVERFSTMQLQEQETVK